ncbi:TraB/GumN family protein [Sphingobacterium bovistauri]|uniref:TraB/GumN family protein n=1 Tax=Sphingobacterium bovistauri TaxID=2781959 RepID=A0ABS7ZBM6_9SPHI|nr:TraB/GumN family protein [Sphingobacterium bovistauri]MCA5006821.1 TraB/GumN family protein [Sphingobacterium bovistauri]
MKNIFVLFAFFNLLIASSFAQENSLLWKISGNNLKNDAYLLGTIHIMCPEDFVMLEKVKKAINDVDQVVYEVDLFNPENTKKMQDMMMVPVPNFFESLSDDKVKFIDSVLTANQMSIRMFDMLNPAMVMSLLTLKSFNCPNPMEVKSVEAEVNTLAEGKQKANLETIDFQLNMLNQIATPEYFYEYLKLYKEAEVLTNKMVQAYKSENLKSLNSIISDPKWMSPKVYDLMLTQRNKTWVDSIPTIISKSKTLIAVGAAHLVGEQGLIELLRDKGYTVAPIMN